MYLSKSVYLDHPKYSSTKLNKGYYYYIGSAQKNLSQRITRHYKKDKSLKWHIDYLTTNDFTKIKNHYTFLLDKNFECTTVSKISEQPDTSFPLPGFGSSDCKNCTSHLLFSRIKIKNLLNLHK